MQAAVYSGIGSDRRWAMGTGTTTDKVGPNIMLTSKKLHKTYYSFKELEPKKGEITISNKYLF